MYKAKVTTLTITEVRKKLSDYDIFKYYIGDFRIGKAFNSPLREDKNPSFSIYSNGVGLKFKDFSTGEFGNPFDFVQKKFNCNYIECLKIINNDFRLGLEKNYTLPTLGIVGVSTDKLPSLKLSETRIEIKKRKWSDTLDGGYWGLYGLNSKSLKKFDVIPVSNVWVNKKMIIHGGLHYAYRLGKGVYKIYSPLSKKKWISNTKAYNYQGFNQITSGELIIITKSMKDVMVLDFFKLQSIAPQSETQYLHEKLISNLKERFKKIIILYDNDEAGELGAERAYSRFKIPAIFIPKDSGCKDISDLVKKYGKDVGKVTINQLIKLCQKEK